MSDYISREAAIKKIRVAAGCAECDGNSSALCTCTICDFYDAIRLIKSLPAADVEPVRPLAEVVEDPRTYPGESRANYGCTACRRILGTWKKGLTFEQLPNFCCWCGAEFTDGGVKSEL